MPATGVEVLLGQSSQGLRIKGARGFGDSKTRSRSEVLYACGPERAEKGVPPTPPPWISRDKPASRSAGQPPALPSNAGIHRESSA